MPLKVLPERAGPPTCSQRTTPDASEGPPWGRWTSYLFSEGPPWGRWSSCTQRTSLRELVLLLPQGAGPPTCSLKVLPEGASYLFSQNLPVNLITLIAASQRGCYIGGVKHWLFSIMVLLSDIPLLRCKKFIGCHSITLRDLEVLPDTWPTFDCSNWEVNWFGSWFRYYGIVKLSKVHAA